MTNALLLIFIYIVWGTTYMAISLALKGFTPFMMASFRYLLCGLIFIPFTRKSDWDIRQAWPHMLGGICLTFANSLVVWSQQKLPSGLAALFVGTVPLWFMLLNWITFEKKKPNILSFLGLIIGMCGLLYLSYASGKDLTLRASALALVFGSLVWSFGSLTIKKAGNSHKILPAMAIQLFVGGLFLQVLAFFNGESVTRNLVQTALGPVMGWAYLVFFGTLLAMSAYIYLLKKMSAHVVGTYALVNPVVAMLLGRTFLDESLSLEMVIATILVLTGVGLILFSSVLKEKKISFFGPNSAHTTSQEPMNHSMNEIISGERK